MRDDLVRICTAPSPTTSRSGSATPCGRWHPGDARVGVEFEHGPSQEVDLVVGADGQHSNIRELAFGRRPVHPSPGRIPVDLHRRQPARADRPGGAVQRAGPGRGDVHRARQQRAKAVLLFRSAPLEIDFRDQAAQQALLRERFAGMGWQTERLVAAMPDAYDFYFDEMSQVKMPSWSAGRVALLGDAGVRAVADVGAGHLAGAHRGLPARPPHQHVAGHRRRHLRCGSAAFAPTWNRTSAWPPTGWPRCCLHRGSASSRATSRCGCCPCWRGWARLRRPDRAGVPRRSRCRPSRDRDGLFGQVERLEYLGRPQPDHQLARHAVAAAVLVGPVGHPCTGRRSGWRCRADQPDPR